MTYGAEVVIPLEIRFPTLRMSSFTLSNNFLFILGVKHKTLHIKLGLGWIGKFCRKINLHEVWSIESNFWSIKPCRFRPINPAITWFQFLQINTLWASLNLDFMFWSWFSNIIHNEVLIHLVPKVFEPNIM